jgi:cellulose synthase/poly-beta-1,6-N-acetylglucosamine synthase-like glycosyltransferase
LGRVGNHHNLLYNLAKGEYVLNLDGDDYLTDSFFISSAIKLFKKDKEVVLVGGKYKRLDVSSCIFRVQKCRFDGSTIKDVILDGYDEVTVNLTIWV